MSVVNGLENEYADAGIAFMRLDANSAEGGELQRSFGLRGHPSIALIDAAGEVTQTFVGAQSAESLRPLLDNIIE